MKNKKIHVSRNQDQILRKSKRRRNQQRWTTVLSLLVVVSILFSFSLPAFAIESDNELFSDNSSTTEEVIEETEQEPDEQQEDEEIIEEEPEESSETEELEEESEEESFEESVMKESSETSEITEKSESSEEDYGEESSKNIETEESEEESSETSEIDESELEESDLAESEPEESELKESEPEESDPEESEPEESEPAAVVTEPAPVPYPAVHLEDVTEDETNVLIDAPEGAFPEGTTLEVHTVQIEEIADAISDTVEGNVVFTTAVDIIFRNAEKVEIEPLLPIQVQIIPKEIPEELVPEEASAQLVHIDEEGNGEIVEQLEETVEDTTSVTFESDEFSIYVVAYTIDYYYRSVTGETYKITLTFTEEANIPEDATLDVREIFPDTEEYIQYLSQLGMTEDVLRYARFFDITILDAEGNPVQPTEGSIVGVKITLADADSDHLKVIHFGAEIEVIGATYSVTEEGCDVSFDATGFSVYAIVELPEPDETEIKKVASLAELKQNTDKGFCLSVTRSYTVQYFTRTMKTGNCFVVSEYAADAAVWYLEPVPEADNPNGNLFYIYTRIKDTDGVVQNYYMKQKDTSSNSHNERNRMELSTDKANNGIFVLSEAVQNGTFYIKLSTENRWVQYSGSGSGIRLYQDNSNAENSCITLTYASSIKLPDDAYGLNGKTYGIAYHNDHATSAALTTDYFKVNGADGLASQKMTMRPDVLDNEGVLLVSEGSDIVLWTFECFEENKYFIKTDVGGTIKYLSINNKNVTLVDSPNNNCIITVIPGTGTNQGKYHFSVNNYYLSLPGGAEKGFGAENNYNKETTWMNVVRKSPMPEEDFTLLNARKVSLSDNTEVYDRINEDTGDREQAEVVIYTRVWNETKKKYEFYVVAHDGTLIPAYDIGDGIEWVGSKVNSALWRFTEYRDAKTGEVNYYYELQNVQYGEYIAPQVTGGQILSDNTIGVNLNGRKYGKNYTTIIAWDEYNYSFAGLKVEDGKLVSCSLSEAADFYFAKMVPVHDTTTEELTQVTTADTNAYGITVRMIDYNNTITSDHRDQGQKNFFGGDTGADSSNSDGTGLLSTKLEDDGYPLSTEKTGHANVSLIGLFTQTDKQPVIENANNLFLESIYKESGYFEYNSTQNYAHLITSDTDPWYRKERPDGGIYQVGDFVIYDQLGAITGNSELKITRQHGQFMPFDDLYSDEYPEGQYAIASNGEYITNQTDVFANELPDTDARKGEKLYKIGTAAEVDYFFGMELTASFTQTANGLDAWGHDIIFEFSGDDDFWLYVDEELVLDLGGVHSAQVGSVNFRTGEINQNGQSTTLYERFKANYTARGYTETKINQELERIFEQNEDGQYVFKDYTNHDMKIFYMERGSGASNLHMRFNLAAVKPGSFLLTKELSGTDNPANDLIEFPYQVYYYTEQDGGSIPHRLGVELPDDATGTDDVLFADSTVQVPYRKSFTPSGSTTVYEDVFFLKPGQSAEVSLPADATEYYVVECGVDTAIYDIVTVNGTVLADPHPDQPGREDFATEPDTLSNRARVTYDNYVHPGAMRTLTITKILYDQTGVNQLHYPYDGSNYSANEIDSTPFAFRLYLGNENADPDKLPLADQYIYYVKDTNNYYCRWNADEQKFESLSYTVFEELAAYLKTVSLDEYDKIVFKTSMYGTISNIPADYTVEVRDLIAGTQWKVEERDWEIPRGYTRRANDGYGRTDSGHVINQGAPISGTIVVENDPKTEVRNQRGWGLSVDKVWTDKDFMQSHDDIFFAVYLEDDLIDGTVRRYTSQDDELYYFFQDCYDDQGNSHDFSEYEVREVKVTTTSAEGLQIDEDGVVTITDEVAVEPIEPDGQISVGGTEANGVYHDSFTYKVSYQQGEPTGHNENVRTDVVTNSRPGIALYKTDGDGRPLEGAVFTLKDADGDDVAETTYTSDENGLITIAYLSEGTYTMTEISAPRGYVGLTSPITFIVQADGSATVSGGDTSTYEVSYEDTEMAMTVTVMNLPTVLEFIKVKADTDEPISGVHFALYQQVKDVFGNWVKYYLPIPGFDDLVTGANGVIPQLNLENTALKVGTYYYLTETDAPLDIQMLTEDFEFSLNANGTITIYKEEQKTWLQQKVVDGVIHYTITIPNGESTKVSIKKVSEENPNMVLSGAIFDLYRVKNDVQADEPLYTGMTSRADGMVELSGGTIFSLPIGTYHLVETKAPAGYNLHDGPIVITVSQNNEGVISVTYDDKMAVYDEESKVFLITVTNSSGFELPLTGGRGTKMLYLIGSMLVLGAGLILFRRRRREG